MLVIFAENWWLHIIRGLLALTFGVMALIWPGLTLGVLVILFGVYVVLEGILTFAAAFKHHRERSWWLLLLEGTAGIVLGLLALIWPAVTAVVLVVIIAIWAIFTGVLEIAAAIQIRREITGEWLLALAGIISVVIGILLIARPDAGALALVWLIGIYAILFGCLLVFLGFKSKKFRG